MADLYCYDIQGKPVRKGSLVALFLADYERMVSARVVCMSNGRLVLRLPVGLSYSWEPHVKPQAVVVLEEPLWPNS